MSCEPILTIDELILARNEEDAVVMGGANGELACTFPRGYLKRQAVYICQTCSEVTGKRAGVCYECSLQCHTDHEVVELYTKRHFRCDCGNSLFKGAAQCKLWEEKDDINEENKYDQTFDGLFCTCSRPYPDPEAGSENEMFQCGLCEDWFHLAHLGLPTDFKPDENFEELTCNNCVQKFPFLWICYYSFIKRNQEINNGSDDDSDFEPDAKKIRIEPNPELPSTSTAANHDTTQTCTLSEVLGSFGVATTQPDPKSLEGLKIKDLSFPSPIFWPSNWRIAVLCSCKSCREMYKNLEVDYLMDPEDSIAHYMKVGKQRVEEMESERDSAISAALAEMPHSVAINVAQGISRLKAAISEFLLKGRERGHVITEEEVKAFCEDLKKDLL